MTIAFCNMITSNAQALSDTNGILSNFHEGYEDDHISATVNSNNPLTVYAKTGFDGAINLNVKTNNNVPLLYDVLLN